MIQPKTSGPIIVTVLGPRPIRLHVIGHGDELICGGRAVRQCTGRRRSLRAAHLHEWPESYCNTHGQVEQPDFRTDCDSQLESSPAGLRT